MLCDLGMFDFVYKNLTLNLILRYELLTTNKQISMLKKYNSISAF